MLILAGGSASTTWTNAIASAYSQNVLSIVAAGNSAVNVSGVSPANALNAITVGAVDSSWRPASFTNYGMWHFDQLTSKSVLVLN